MSISKDVSDSLEKEVTQEIQEIAHALAKESVDPLESFDAKSIKIEHQLSQCMLLAKTRIREGFTFCVRAVEELARVDAAIDLGQLKENVNYAFSRFESVAVAKDMCTKLMEGYSWKSLLGLSDETVSLLYQGAKKLFEAGHNPEAEAAFFFLTTVDFAQYAFWLGLGHAAFNLGNINQALNAYEMADTCQPNAIWPHIYMANCFEVLHDYEESLVSLQNAERELLLQQEPNPKLATELKERIINAKNRA